MLRILIVLPSIALFLQHGMTALLWAADMGHLQVLELLLHSGADMTLVDDNGLTALLWAADRGHVECVKALLDAGIDVNIVDKVSVCMKLCFVAVFVVLKLDFSLMELLTTLLTFTSIYRIRTRRCTARPMRATWRSCRLWWPARPTCSASTRCVIVFFLFWFSFCLSLQPYLVSNAVHFLIFPGVSVFLPRTA